MIVFDTETTGIPKPQASKLSLQPQIIEFAAIKLDDETLKEVDRIQFLVNPKVKLPDKIVQITNITDKMLADEKPFNHHFPTLVDFFFGERKMIAHNLGFDRDMLKFEMMRMGTVLNFPWPPIHICTVEATFSMKGHRLKAGDLYEMATGREMKGAHRAMADVEALVEIVKRYDCCRGE